MNPVNPPFAEAREKMAAALGAGALAPETPIESNLAAIDNVCGWDSQDWVELMLWSEELSAELTTVGDVLKLLERIGSRYQER